MPSGHPLSLAIASMLAAGCAQVPVVDCADGRSCPADYTCYPGGCLSPGQRAACSGLADGDACSLDGEGGYCDSGGCIVARCGNLVVEKPEVCDDGNLAAGDGCSGDCASKETCGNGIVDGVNDEACDDNNRVEHDGCSSACRDETPRWTKYTIAPGGRGGGAAAYDKRRDRLVVFGGRPDVSAAEVSNETIEFDGRAWTTVAEISAPSPRWDTVMAFDDQIARSVLFGGESDSFNIFGDTWLWDGSRWTRSDAVAPAREGQVMVYDPRRERVVMFGGRNGSTLLDDTWEFDGTTWTQVTSTPHPSARASVIGAYDDARGVVVVTGGFVDLSYTAAQDTWELDATGWHLRASTGPALFGAGATWDAASQHVIMVAGQDSSLVLHDETWRWDGTSWAQMTTITKPAARVHPNVVNVAGITTLFGGSGSGVTYDDTWRLIGGDWQQLREPPARLYAASSEDVLGAFSMVFGGRDAAGVGLGDTWIRDQRGWHEIIGAGPSAREAAIAAYDPAHAKTVMIGGKPTGGASSSIFGETWLFDSTTRSWSQGPAAPARMSPGMAFDVARQRVVMFGGNTTAGVAGDTWEWDGSSWTQVLAAGGPSPRSAVAMGYDATRAQVVLFGGLDSTTVFDDTWTYDGTWHRVDIATHPPPAVGNRFTWSPARQRLVLTGGRENTWEWTGTRWDVLPIVGGLPQRRLHVAVRPAEGDGVVAFSGQNPVGFAVVDDTWILSWSSEGTSESCVSSIDSDGDGLALCDDPDCWPVCTPLCPPATSCPVGAPACGDGTCAPGRESCQSCPGDCGTCEVCGDGQCTSGETCPGDCG